MKKLKTEVFETADENIDFAPNSHHSFDQMGINHREFPRDNVVISWHRTP